MQYIEKLKQIQHCPLFKEKLNDVLAEYNNDLEVNKTINSENNKLLNIFFKGKKKKIELDHNYYVSKINKIIIDTIKENHLEYINAKNLYETYLKTINGYELKENKYKLYPLEINSHETNFDQILLHEVLNGSDISTVASMLKQKYVTEIEKVAIMLNDGEVETYYGNFSFLKNYLVTMEERIIKLLSASGPNQSLKSIIEIYLNDIRSKNREIKLIDFKETDFETQKKHYEIIEKYYINAKSIESYLMTFAENIWKNKLTDPEKFKDGDDFAFIVHTFTDGEFKPQSMQKACATYITNKTMPVPYNNGTTFGLIYPFKKENISAMSTRDAGSWVIKKDRFFEGNVNYTWQLDEVIDEKGNYVFYETASDLSKLILPDEMENTTLWRNYEYNGEHINYSKGTLYNEILINNKGDGIMPSGVYMIYDEQTDIEGTLKKATKYAWENNLPLVKIDRSLYKTKANIKTKVHAAEEEMSKTI